MHERTQRAVARLLFVFCCALPTAVVLSTIVVSWTPWYQARRLAAIRYQLCRETGLVIELDRCRLIAPGKYVLENVRVRDPETREPVATIRVVDFYRGDDHTGILLHQPELESAGLGRAWSLLHDRLISRPEHTLRPLILAANDVTIHSREGALSLSEVSAHVTPEDHGVRLTAEGQSSGRADQPRLRVDLFRDRSGTAPRTELVVSTDGTALPCSALSEYLPALKKLGPEAQFTGMVQCDQSPAGWSFDFASSSLTDLNLSFLTDSLPHRVVGTAELHLRRCLIQPGRSVHVIGTAKASRLRVGVPLLRAMRERLGLELDLSEFDPARGGVDCKLAAVDFEINDQTMQLTGVCDPFGTGIVNHVALYARGRPIAWTAGKRIDSGQITAVLQPPSESLSRWNQVFLPAPPSAASPATSEPPGVSQPAADASVQPGQPRGRIRRVQRWSGEATIRQR
jgi:hypothetical protein